MPLRAAVLLPLFVSCLVLGVQGLSRREIFEQQLTAKLVQNLGNTTFLALHGYAPHSQHRRDEDPPCTAWPAIVDCTYSQSEEWPEVRMCYTVRSGKGYSDISDAKCKCGCGPTDFMCNSYREGTWDSCLKIFHCPGWDGVSKESCEKTKEMSIWCTNQCNPTPPQTPNPPPRTTTYTPPQTTTYTPPPQTTTYTPPPQTTTYTPPQTTTYTPPPQTTTYTPPPQTTTYTPPPQTTTYTPPPQTTTYSPPPMTSAPPQTTTYTPPPQTTAPPPQTTARPPVRSEAL